MFTRKIILILVIVFPILGVAAFALATYTATNKVQQVIAVEQAEFITVNKGSSFNQFSKQLVNKGWLESKFWLRSYSLLHPEFTKIKSGTYQVLPETRLIDLLESFALSQLLGRFERKAHFFIHGTKNISTCHFFHSIECNPRHWSPVSGLIHLGFLRLLQSRHN